MPQKTNGEELDWNDELPSEEKMIDLTEMEYSYQLLFVSKLANRVKNGWPVNPRVTYLECLSEIDTPLVGDGLSPEGALQQGKTLQNAINQLTTTGKPSRDISVDSDGAHDGSLEDDKAVIFDFFRMHPQEPLNISAQKTIDFFVLKTGGREIRDAFRDRLISVLGQKSIVTGKNEKVSFEEPLDSEKLSELASSLRGINRLRKEIPWYKRLYRSLFDSHYKKASEVYEKAINELVRRGADKKALESFLDHPTTDAEKERKAAIINGEKVGPRGEDPQLKEKLDKLWQKSEMNIGLLNQKLVSSNERYLKEAEKREAAEREAEIAERRSVREEAARRERGEMEHSQEVTYDVPLKTNEQLLNDEGVEVKDYDTGRDKDGYGYKYARFDVPENFSGKTATETQDTYRPEDLWSKENAELHAMLKSDELDEIELGADDGSDVHRVQNLEADKALESDSDFENEMEDEAALPNF